MNRRSVRTFAMFLGACALGLGAPALAQNRTATIVVELIRLQGAPPAPAAAPAPGPAPEAGGDAAAADTPAPGPAPAPAATPAPASGALVTATSTGTGSVTPAVARKDGSHILTGLEPGEYLITANADGREVFEVVTVQVGQSLNLKLDMGMQAQGETVVVKGHLVDTATSEVAVNVSREQMDNLPQSTRNFLNFAGLAPGIHMSTDPFRKTVSSGATDASAVNVFVDGVSLKNNVTEGGLVGQDASRGNPFPQLAVAGFRVISQNFKAEYEQAGGAVISATTRSGTNDFHGEALATFQNQYLMEQDYFALQRGEPPADLSRLQFAGAMGGPILKDKLFFFATYEGNAEQRANRVSLGNPTPENQARFGAYEGSFPSPFREHLAFGKLTWRPADGQTLDVTTSYRTESDVRSFGGTSSYQTAENVKNNVLTVSARHEWWLPFLTNEATVQYFNFHFNPLAQSPTLVGQEYQGVIRLGGRDTNQDIVQRSFTLRDDVTFPALEAVGPHVVKAGAKLAFQHYGETKYLFGNPLFRYRIDPANNLDYNVPFEASYGVGDPNITAENTQIGLYVQDDWQPFKRLTVNVGVRWDVETSPLNNSYVTPQNIRDAMTQLADQVAQVNGPDFFPVDKYLTDGTQRPPFLGAIQPRLGLAFDVLGDGSTIVFGGAGRYYDRTLYNTGVDELYRLQYQVRTFQFSPDGSQRNGQDTIQWQNSYLSKAGLDGLIASGTAPSPEIFLIQNDTKPMHTDQFSLGARRAVGPMNLSLTGGYVHGENGVGFYPANREATGARNWLPSAPGFGNVIISTNDRETWYTSVQLVAEKPLSAEWSAGGVQWGATLAYTFGVAR
ncbi:MAG TPA: TonB-dependent receptor, partial [Myxococcales bacterium]|nr:TonB-dependent receptor [Myxococcales bacterium]